jgi:hypothetical protein
MDYSYVGSLWTFLAFGDFKLNLIALAQGFKSFTLNSRVVDKYILPIFCLYKSKALFLAEPFNLTFSS